MKILRPHQQIVFDWTLQRKNFALFLEMRLGKTLIMIRNIEHFNLKKILVVCPGPAFISWKDELKEEGYGLSDFKFLTGSTKDKHSYHYQKNCRWTLTNYETFNSLPSLVDENWSCLILDESTKIKNPRTDVSKFFCSNRLKHIPRKTVLSGCPNPEGELDFFQQMKFLFSEFMGCENYWQYEYKYFSQFGFISVPRKKYKHKIKEAISENSYFLTRKAAGIKETWVYEKRMVELKNPTLKKMYKEICDDFLTTYKNVEYSTKYATTKCQFLERVASGFLPDGSECISEHKNQEIEYLLKNDLKKEKVVIWFKYNAELENTVKYLRDKKFSVDSFYGKHRSGVRNFQKGKCQILCIQQKLGMVSLNLSISSTAIYYSKWHSYEMRRQSKDRINHLTKTDSYLVIDLLTENTIDEKIHKAVQKKEIRYEAFAESVYEHLLKTKGVNK